MSEQCQATVYKRDTYRRTGEGPSGFSMYYNEERCSFKSKEVRQKYSDSVNLCSRHAKIFDRSIYLIQVCKY